MVFNGKHAIFMLFCKFSMIFNGSFASCKLSMLFNGSFAVCQFPMLFDGNWRLKKLWGGGRTDGQTYIMVHPCVLQDIGPLGPLPKKHACPSPSFLIFLLLILRCFLQVPPQQIVQCPRSNLPGLLRPRRILSYQATK